MMQDYSLGSRIEVQGDHDALLRNIVGLQPLGVALEFGVGKGGSTRIIAEHMPVIGFDSFEGLPADWREGFPAGMFACPPPRVSNTRIVTGLFEDTLPRAPFDLFSSPIALVHIDCDLYASTKTVLDHLGPYLKAGTYVVFDEWYGYEGCEQFEQLVWREFAACTGIGWTVVGHGFQQWGLQIV